MSSRCLDYLDFSYELHPHHGVSGVSAEKDLWELLSPLYSSVFVSVSALILAELALILKGLSYGEGYLNSMVRHWMDGN